MDCTYLFLAIINCFACDYVLHTTVLPCLVRFTKVSITLRAMKLSSPKMKLVKINFKKNHRNKLPEVGSSNNNIPEGK